MILAKGKHAPVICAECGKRAQCVSGRAIYPHRPDLFIKNFWLCECGAYCGCHGLTKAPLGTPAGPDLRKARNAAHRVFDRLWERKRERDRCSKEVARRAGYTWLSEQMGVPFEQTHIAMFNIAQCAQVVALCTQPRGSSGGDAA
jgi:hypothetical protein